MRLLAAATYRYIGRTNTSLGVLPESFLSNTVLKGMERFREYSIMVLPDNPTPIRIRTHAPDPVPFAIFSTERGSSGRQGKRGFSEREARRSGALVKGHELMGKFLKGKRI